MNICFIGFGNMAKALAKNLRAEKHWHLFASSPSLPIAPHSQEISTHSDNRFYLKNAHVVILAVKPQKIAEVLQEIAAHLSGDCLLISLAAGVPLATFAEFIPEHPCVRAMPNTPIAVHQGATALIANAYVSEQQKNTIEKLFQHAGITAWLAHEDQMDAITALSGSGPAYLYLFIESLMTAAESLKLPKSLVEAFTLQTVQGALTLLKKSPLSPQELRTQVTSPGGTTAAALAVFEQKGFSQMVYDAMSAAHQRAQELGNITPIISIERGTS